MVNILEPDEFGETPLKEAIQNGVCEILACRTFPKSPTHKNVDVSYWDGNENVPLRLVFNSMCGKIVEEVYHEVKFLLENGRLENVEEYQERKRLC